MIAHDTPSIPPHLDIKARIPETVDTSAGKPRPRGSGKLLSNVGGVGLALLRIAHVHGCEAGTVNLEFDTKGADETVARTWSVKHWRPEGWPIIENEQES